MLFCVIKIEIDYSNNLFHRFTIIEADGTKFHFGKSPTGNENAYEYTYEGLNIENFYPTTWYLVKIESHDGLNEINLSYDNENYSYHQPASCQFIGVAQHCLGGTGSEGGISCSSSGSLNIRGNATYEYLRMNVRGKRLSTITTSTETLSFVAGATREDLDANTAQGGNLPKSLSAIELSTGTFCKNYNFFYDYFADKELTAAYALRLKLDSIREETCTGISPAEIIPPHIFTYDAPVYSNNGHVNDGRQIIQHRLSKAIDYWGYANGSTVNEGKRLNVPDMDIVRPNGNISYDGGSNRLPNAAAMDNGLLSEIRYPTGGKTSLFFEPHDYAATTTDDQVIAGPVSNCDSWGTLACCSTTGASLDYTFSKSDSANAFIRLTLYHNDATGDSLHTDQGQPNTNSPLMCNNFTDDAFLLLTITETLSGNQIGTNFEFNFNSYTPNNVIIGQEMLRKVSDNVPALKAGVSYTLSIEMLNGRGVLEIIKPSDSFTPQIVGGMRIQRIVTHDGISTDNDQTRSFEYKLNDGNSSGHLQGYPQYGYFGVVNTGNSTADITYTLIKDSPIVPLQSFQGFVVGYEQVTEFQHHNGVKDGNGKTVYEYFVNETSNPVLGLESDPPTYPIVPANYIARNSPLKNQSIYHQNGTRLVYNQTEETVPSEPLAGLPAKVLRISSTPSCDPTGWTEDNMDQETGHIYSFYPLVTSVFLPKKVTNTQDNVPTVTTYTYEDLSNHLYATKVTEEISTGQTYITKNRYVFDEAAMQANSAYSQMVERNIIATPIKVTEEVLDNNVTTQIRGAEFKMAAFDKTTGKKVTCCAGSDPRLDSLLNYEISWDENGTVLYSSDDTDQDHWVLNKTHAEYDPLTGNATKVVMTHWDTLYYGWNAQNKLLTNQRFKTHEKQIRYYPNTSFLSGITQIDGQIDSINYDGLIRPSEIWTKQGNVITNFDYGYRLKGDNINFFKATTTYTAQTRSDLIQKEVIDYQDGINRSIQQIQRKHSPDASNPKDIITHQRYDDRGRLARQYEPFKSSYDTGAYAADTTGVPVTLKQYEPSPLNRLSQETLPNWYSTSFTYGSNSGTDNVIDYNNATTFVGNILFKKTQIDGNGNHLSIFANSREKTILTRRSDGNSAKNDTYTLYDVKERKAAVYPPNSNGATTNLIYEYFYDAADNQILKKIPDADTIRYVFNNRDLPIGMQGGNLENDGKWMVTEYDEFGRVIKKGLNTSPTTVNEIWTRTFWDGEVETGSSFVGFIPLEIPKELKGEFELTELSAAPSDNSTNPIYKGKIHYTESAMINGNIATTNRLFSINQYDNFGRVSRVQTDNHLGGSENTVFFYDFANNQTRATRFHKHKITSSDIVTNTQNFFDHQGRNIRKNHLITGIGAFSTDVYSLEYDDKDLVKTKKLGANGNGGFLQEIDYNYLPNRLLSGINSTMTAEDLFQFNINYDQQIVGLSGSGQKNGNITNVNWQVKGGQSQTYGFHYDYLDRLTAANYSLNNNAYGSTYSYDDRGNIVNITRRGMYNDGSNFAPQQIDNLTFMPISGTNKVETITDAAPCPDSRVIHQALDNTELHAVGATILADNLINETGEITYQAGTSITLQSGFHAKAGTSFTAKIEDCPTEGYETDGFAQRSTNSYLYDSNGNQTRDPNKGITTLYNYLNLPYRITFDNGNVIEWLYNANGMKLQKLAKQNGIVEPKLTLDYFDNFEYQNDTLDLVYLTNAKLVFEKGDFKEYQFFIKDNVGNNRVVFRDNSGVAEIINQSHFYPFGGQMKGEWQTDDRVKKLFNGIEQVNDFGLSLYHAKFRTYDPWGMSWGQIDPKAEQFYAWSPYNNNFNNPIINSDPNGDCPTCVGGAIAGGLVEALTQFTVNLAKGQSPLDAAGNIDLVDVGAASLEGGITSGGSIMRRLLIKGSAMVVSETVQNLADVEIDGDSDIIGVGDSDKTAAKVAVNTVVGVSANLIGSTSEAIVKGTRKTATREAALKKVDRELQPSRSLNGSEGQASRIQQREALVKSLARSKFVNDNVSAATGIGVTETLKDKAKID